MTANGDELPYGLRNAVPAAARTAWGARLIVTQQGHVDLPYDRFGCAGEGRSEFLQLLNASLSPDELLGRIADLLKTGEMNTRVSKEIVVYEDDKIEVRANTNASAGYCYVAAWLKEGVQP